ncbi:trans-cinnamate:CoA ligase, peroxisomal-like [Typha latifolia]|uniref:trans-cinnamate:CoA ligase, peroxisomal-like n=1 Tax=Typha latifolia TaxID=4733 RepID=UPI003C2B3010
MDKLPKCQANYAPLSPVTFLERAAAVYADQPSVLYEGTAYTWKQTYERCRRLASSLRALNVSKNDVVSVLAPNVPALYEMHFAVPMAGAVLNTINTRLDAPKVASILKHAEAKAFFVDYQYVPLADAALEILAAESIRPPLLFSIDDVDSPKGVKFGKADYEHLVARGDPSQPPAAVTDEWDSIALNYTSGTTSEPKGVVYSHRGAYLSTLSLLLQWEVKMSPVYLWTLPMFHCNGWTFTWGVAARGGANVCLRSPAAADIYAAIAAHGVTHMCCAPIIFNILLEAPRKLPHPVHVLTGGAPPPAALLEKVEWLNFRVTHAYGLTEATGPALVCEWHAKWDLLPSHEKARLKARQGVGVVSLADADVKDPKTMASVPRDGASVGEIVLRGSSIMKGYYKNTSDTAAAFRDGWFLTGDVGVIHRDGYIEIKDRAKDVIISGGENISSVEVEAVLYKHPMVVEAAVVAMPHPKWGESPCAFVVLKKEYYREEGGFAIREEDIISYCRNNLSGFMVPKKVVFMEELPKTSTGKIQKFLLRELARGTCDGSSRVETQVEQVLAMSRL